MKVFLSWSGDRSKAVAELLDEWLQCVLQAVNPWMSSKDIDRGSLWFSEIADTLGDTRIGIVCLTQENKSRPWILFEAGALAKGLSSTRVCTLLIDLEPTDVANPLAQFNHTSPTREGIFQLLATINKLLGENALNPRVLERVFETYWSQFDERFKEILEEFPSTQTTPPEEKERDILREILGSIRDMEHRVRRIEGSTKNPPPPFSPPFLPLGENSGHLNYVENLRNSGFSEGAIAIALSKRGLSDSLIWQIMGYVSAGRTTPPGPSSDVE